MPVNAKRLAMLALCAGLFSSTVNAKDARTVVVKPGDTLSKIAERELGRKDRLLEICTLNRKVLVYDCDYLPAGTVLALPARGDDLTAQPKPAASANEDRGDRKALGGDFVARFTGSSGRTFITPRGYKAMPANGFVRVSGHLPSPLAGSAPGVLFKLPDSIERRASSKTVLVEVLARAPIPGPISLAYFTNEVGNSGWITKSAGTTFRKLSFSYRVPPMKDGRGDYVGIQPDPKNARQVLDVAGIAVTVLVE